MECKFTIGQKVVCIGYIHRLEGYVEKDKHGFIHPVKCGIYTIRELLLCPKNQVPMLRVMEIRNPLHSYTAPWGVWEIAWYHRNFRPLQDIVTKEETKTDISLFKRILQEVTQKESSNV